MSVLRRTGRALLAMLVVSVPAVGWATTTEGASLEGRWLTQTRDGVIDVRRCGASLCGFIAGMVYDRVEPTDAWHRPQCGLNLLLAMKPDGDGWSGRILDPDNGHAYAAHVHLAPDGTFKLHGYVGIPLFGATQTWTRFDGGPIGPDCRMSGPGR